MANLRQDWMLRKNSKSNKEDELLVSNEFLLPLSLEAQTALSHHELFRGTWPICGPNSPEPTALKVAFKSHPTTAGLAYSPTELRNLTGLPSSIFKPITRSTPTPAAAHYASALSQPPGPYATKAALNQHVVKAFVSLLDSEEASSTISPVTPTTPSVSNTVDLSTTSPSSTPPTPTDAMITDTVPTVASLPSPSPVISPPPHQARPFQRRSPRHTTSPCSLKSPPQTTLPNCPHHTHRGGRGPHHRHRTRSTTGRGHHNPGRGLPVSQIISPSSFLLNLSFTAKPPPDTPTNPNTPPRQPNPNIVSPNTSLQVASKAKRQRHGSPDTTCPNSTNHNPNNNDDHDHDHDDHDDHHDHHTPTRPSNRYAILFDTDDDDERKLPAVPTAKNSGRSRPTKPSTRSNKLKPLPDTHHTDATSTSTTTTSASKRKHSRHTGDSTTDDPGTAITPSDDDSFTSSDAQKHQLPNDSQLTDMLYDSPDPDHKALLHGMSQLSHTDEHKYNELTAIVEQYYSHHTDEYHELLRIAVNAHQHPSHHSPLLSAPLSRLPPHLRQRSHHPYLPLITQPSSLHHLQPF